MTLNLNRLTACLLGGAACVNLALASPAPLWDRNLTESAYVSTGERVILAKAAEELSSDSGVIQAAYIEYKLARQRGGQDHRQALANLASKDILPLILSEKLSLYRQCGCVYADNFRPSDFLGLKTAFFNAHEPERFLDLIKAFEKAWYTYP